ncbi:alanyl-tRNA editing protein [archaeon]|jgi:misacylated tRNA(Ala) deacylase|nr:alanyl-tRNA editing protein [archaeon]MBT4022881.1 alanyl-tRNA editing protein [archaeon]MBT4272528.1 alanyl-tRNA editing protein [archaeon]MBT4460404.1 alanyl-tRNA editing protein [archaeon]MBT4859035.1 alanyl-tRNA editing protein [archaeon]
MTKALYMDNSYLKEFEAKISSVKDKFIILDQTAFFPKGGGLEWDTGKIIRKSDNQEFKVVYVGKFNGEISHEVDILGLKQGDEIKCFIDWERRYKLMRYHTGTHVLCGIFSREYNLLVTGNQLTTEKGRVDLNMETMDLKLVKEAFSKANDIIKKDLDVEIYYKSMEEAKKDPTLFKLAIGFPHDIKKLRIVDIVNFDAQADGGCHVKSLKEIGKLVFKEAVNKGKQNRRIYFTVE